jgi:hypothetical protein
VNTSDKESTDPPDDPPDEEESPAGNLFGIYLGPDHPEQDRKAPEPVVEPTPLRRVVRTLTERLASAAGVRERAADRERSDDARRRGPSDEDDDSPEH